MKKRLDKILPIIALVMLVSALVILIIGQTYAANSSDTPIHVLHYDTGRLYWSHGSERIDERGVYKLSLFESLPTGDDGEKILSPGDAYKNTIELRNKTGHEVSYTAVLYKISGDNVPIITDFSNISSANNEEFYTLPAGVADSDVVRAVSGNISAQSIQSFEIDWKWEYFVSDEQDKIDTALGNLEYSDVVMGVWITVNDPSTVTPVPPKEDTNLDINGDGIPDVNIDTDGDGEAELNIDTDGDERADINIDEDGDGNPDVKLDINGDGIADFNYDTDGNGYPNEDIIEITVVDGVVIIPPASFIKIISLPEITNDLTLKLDNLGKNNIIGVDLPKEELSDFVEGGGKVKIVMTSIEVELDNEALAALIDSATGTNVRIIVKAILPTDLTETERSSIEEGRLAYAFEAYVLSGSQIIRELTAGKIKISVPYEPYQETSINDYKVYDVKNNGALNDTGASYENGKFILEATSLLRYAVVYEGDLDILNSEPEPHDCSCFICVFGKDNCRFCWLCWTFLFLVIFAIVAVILKCLGVLNAKR